MLSLIVAVANNNVIGKNNKMVWHLSDDLKRFKNITMNKTIIMGRKTFESLPFILPNRNHIIITNNRDYKVNDQRVKIFYDFEEIIQEFMHKEEEAFVIGGATIYNLSLKYCSKIYLTKIYEDFIGDTFLDLNLDNYRLVYESDLLIDIKSNLKYKYLNYSAIVN